MRKKKKKSMTVDQVYHKLTANNFAIRSVCNGLWIEPTYLCGIDDTYSLLQPVREVINAKVIRIYNVHIRRYHAETLSLYDK